MNGWTPNLPEDEILTNLLDSVDDYLEKHPDNEWWQNLRINTKKRLDELYDLRYGVLFRDSMDWHREQQELLITM